MSRRPLHRQTRRTGLQEAATLSGNAVTPGRSLYQGQEVESGDFRQIRMLTTDRNMIRGWRCHQGQQAPNMGKSVVREKARRPL